jgi:hypothetical protein
MRHFLLYFRHESELGLLCLICMRHCFGEIPRTLVPSLMACGLLPWVRRNSTSNHVWGSHAWLGIFSLKCVHRCTEESSPGRRAKAVKCTRRLGFETDHVPSDNFICFGPVPHMTAIRNFGMLDYKSIGEFFTPFLYFLLVNFQGQIKRGKHVRDFGCSSTILRSALKSTLTLLNFSAVV